MMISLVSSATCTRTIFTPEEIKTTSQQIKIKVLDQEFFSNRISNLINLQISMSVKCILLLVSCKMWEASITLCSSQASLFMAASKVPSILLPLYLNCTKWSMSKMLPMLKKELNSKVLLMMIRTLLDNLH